MVKIDVPPTPYVNPLREQMVQERVTDSCVMVIFGASGDLSQRKLMPALYNLALTRMLPHGFTVIGVSGSQWTNEEFRERIRQAIERSSEVPELNPSVWESFSQGLFYLPGDFRNPDVYDKLCEEIDRVDRERRTGGNRLFYLATPPSFFVDIIEHLGSSGVASGAGTERKEGWSRIVIEKPVGRDLQSAQELNHVVNRVFDEDDVYRIDHYLGKETVQNLLVLRFANTIYEPVWNRRYIDHVQITAAEDLGVEHRARYYEEAGAVRDMFQNHLLQLMSLVAMEPPVAFSAKAVRDEKFKVLSAIRPYTPEEVQKYAVAGQYGQGVSGGQPVAGYRQEPGVAPESNTETYFAVKLFVDNWRWTDVPFYLRSGKRLPKKVTEIAIQFKQVPHIMFNLTPRDEFQPNVLAIRIQPDEGISLKFSAKQPGRGVHIRQVNMNFLYDSAFGMEPATAYETLLLDAIRGDATLFNRADSVEQSWRIAMPLLDYWTANKHQDFPNYPAGTWNPPSAEEMIRADGREWRRP